MREGVVLRLQENAFIATGFSGNGMTFGTLSGLLVRDLVIGQPNPLAALYGLSRA